MSCSKLSQKAVMHQHQKHHQNKIWMESGEFPNARILRFWRHPKKPKSYKNFGVLLSIFARVLRHVISQNLVALKRIHKPADKSGVPLIWSYSNLDICPSPEIGNKFQPSFIMVVIIEDYIAEMVRRNVKARWIIC